MFSYSFDKGWEKIKFEFDYDSFDDSDKAYRAAGFVKVYEVPSQVSENFFCTDVYVFDSGLGVGHSEFKYMVLLYAGEFENIMVRDLPSLIELLSKTSTVNISTMFSESEAEKIQDFTASELNKMRM